MARNSVAYEDDFFTWTLQQARLLRDGEFAHLDAANLAEEIESVGANDRREIRSRLLILLVHLLKYRFQAKRRSGSWAGTIREQRRRIELVLIDSPSLRPFVLEVLAHTYNRARLDAAEETRMPASTFPDSCPFTLDEILSEDFLPEV